ncbi:hypothetical protein [Arthrobacter bambusae]|uniref:Uncharacterized protein n=1 Tax=Arthrobacter bambusae TaxID=1338426 RepID=A0AAW8D5G1_9MICC|nr:hypothetical protein [Arthrobacter bambusae]MDP9903113.1 hypothetical protein [Arthrobacter bambusae]MDQ0128893.1 hypothetical protein [Arthrobacter bambusae]MDQ0180234.1 hypothetical protein [Arthrobacter bambusae]
MKRQTDATTEGTAEDFKSGVELVVAPGKHDRFTREWNTHLAKYG